MKTKSLQFKKAMSAALFVLLLNVVGLTNAFAQTQVATLQHEGDIVGSYYGENALTSAYNAASDGDIITLSSGTFSCPDIMKSVTIRGAGCVFDSVTNVMKTQISSNFSLSMSSCNNASFEGIHFSGTITCNGSNYYPNNRIGFVKCAIYKIQLPYTKYGNNYNYSFDNCIIKNFNSYYTYGTTNCGMLGLSFINSVVRFVDYNHTNILYPTTIYNSVVLFDSNQVIKNIIAYNSIIATVSGHAVSNCTFFNCINIKTGETSLFDGQTCSNVMEVNGYDDVFETFNGSVSYDNIYQLKNNIATSFMGQDGTEVGIYGGTMPYNPRPSYMMIKRCNVAPRSTVDGKLSVDIEIIAED